MGTLHGASGGKGPARLTLALIFRLGDSALINPVDGFGNALFLQRNERLMLEISIADESENAPELGLGPVRELVVAGLPALARVVVLLDPVVHEGELLEAVHELLDVCNLTVVSGHVANVFEVDRCHARLLGQNRGPALFNITASFNCK